MPLRFARKREALVQELLKLDAENAAVIFLVNMVDVFGINKRVQGFENNMMRLNYSEMTLSN